MGLRKRYDTPDVLSMKYQIHALKLQAKKLVSDGWLSGKTLDLGIKRSKRALTALRAQEKKAMVRHGVKR